MLDIHAHILPCVDDGSQSVEESLALLQMMKEQGITDVIATPHFYPHEDTLEAFEERTSKAYLSLKAATAGKDLPNIYLGCELLYFEGIEKVSSLSEFCISSSPYLLLELTDGVIDETLFKSLASLREDCGLYPIIAHAERYYKAKRYKKLLSVLSKYNIPVQINASSVVLDRYAKAIKMLMKSNIAIVLATDTHSVKGRPPKMAEAIEILEKGYGKEYVAEILENSNRIYKNINRI